MLTTLSIAAEYHMLGHAKFVPYLRAVPAKYTAPALEEALRERTERGKQEHIPGEALPLHTE